MKTSLPRSVANPKVMSEWPCRLDVFNGQASRCVGKPWGEPPEFHPLGWHLKSSRRAAGEERVKAAYSKRPRQFRFANLPLLILLIAALASSAAARRHKSPSPHHDLRDKINDDAQQLGGVALEDSEPITTEIQNLVINDLDAWMSSHPPTFVEVRSHLDQVFSKLRNPFFGQGAAMAAVWHGENLILAGYTLGWSDYDRVNVIDVYEEKPGATPRPVITSFFPRTDLHFLAIPQMTPRDFQFIAYGSRLGKSHPRLSATLYSFDGRTLKSLWQRQDAFDGKIAVQGDEIFIRYLNEDEFINATERNQLPARHEAVYRLTGKGLDLITIRDVPY